MSQKIERDLPFMVPDHVYLSYWTETHEIHIFRQIQNGKSDNFRNKKNENGVFIFDFSITILQKLHFPL